MLSHERLTSGEDAQSQAAMTQRLQAKTFQKNIETSAFEFGANLVLYDAIESPCLE